MYHLLVRYSGWSETRDSLSQERVFEYTADEIANQFAPNGRLDTNQISNIPALFVTETVGSGPQEARIGYITDTHRDGDKVLIKYQYDHDISPIPNSALVKISEQLAISEYEFRRTHWSIKNVDLYKALVRSRPIVPFSPRVFELDETEAINHDLISVMMPFSPQFKPVYETLKSLADELGAECLRADDIWENSSVIQDIVFLINRSNIVVCDFSGRNSNVFYEAGIAHTLGREVIPIAQSESDIPFDLRHLRFVTYLNNNEGRRQLANELKPRVNGILKEI